MGKAKKVNRQLQYNMMRVTYHRGEYWALCRGRAWTQEGVREVSVELVP